MSKRYQSPEAYLREMIQQGYIPAKDILPPQPAINPVAMPGIGHPKPEPITSPIRRGVHLGKMNPCSETKKHQHQLGSTPCGRCSISRHEQCRPHLQGDLCSCSCAIATKMREHYGIEKNLALEVGDPVPSVWDFAKANTMSIFGRKLHDPRKVKEPVRITA